MDRLRRHEFKDETPRKSSGFFHDVFRGRCFPFSFIIIPFSSSFYFSSRYFSCLPNLHTPHTLVHTRTHSPKCHCSRDQQAVSGWLIGWLVFLVVSGAHHPTRSTNSRRQLDRQSTTIPSAASRWKRAHKVTSIHTIFFFISIFSPPPPPLPPPLSPPPSSPTSPLLPPPFFCNFLDGEIIVTVIQSENSMSKSEIPAYFLWPAIMMMIIITIGRRLWPKKWQDGKANQKESNGNRLQSIIRSNRFDSNERIFERFLALEGRRKRKRKMRVK